MPKTSKIAISLPEEVLTAVEREREESGESRSQIFRRAVDLEKVTYTFNATTHKRNFG